MLKRCIGYFSLLCILPVGVMGADYSFPYDGDISNTNNADIGQSFKENALGDDSTSEELQRTYNVAWDSEGDQRATDYIRIIINWFLAVVGLIALVVIIIGFYKMLVAGDSEAAWGDARKMVINAAIALAVIGIAWFVVSWFFEIFFIVSSEI